jgi:membrane protease YdiL (CAAX protease family)
MKWPGMFTMIGLFLALGGPIVFTGHWGRTPEAPGLSRGGTRDQIVMWAVLALVITIVIFGEGLSLDSIGLHAPTWGTLGWGIAGASLVEVTGAIFFPFLTRAGIVDYSKKLGVLEEWPLWLTLFAVLTAGVVEEALYRGYAIERFSRITGSYWWAAAVSVVIFGLVHLPFWGRGALVWSIFAGSVFTVLYLWKHDLLSCMIAHIISNLKALLFDPVVRRHRKHANQDSAMQLE